MTTPNAFILGTPAAGGSTLARDLAQHPEVFVPSTAAPNHYLFGGRPPHTIGPAPAPIVDFALHRSSVIDDTSFRRLYEPGRDHPVRLDASVRYLYETDALDRIWRQRPDARHIVVLRDPLERIESHWRHNRQHQLEPLPLAAAVDAEDERVRAGWGSDWHYRRVSTYSPQLERLLERFAMSQVHVVLHGDLVADAERVIRSYFEFLDVAPDVEVDRSEPGGLPTEPRILALDRLVSRPTRVRRLLRTLPRSTGDRVLQRVVDWNSGPPPPVVDLTAASTLRRRFEQDHVVMAGLLGLEPSEYVRRLGSRAAVRTHAAASRAS